MTKILLLAFSIIAVFVSGANVRAQTNTKPVGAGETAPDFMLVDHHGAKVKLSDSRDKSPVVLVFYRGYW